MTWRFDGFDREPVREEVLVGFDGSGDGASITGFGGGDRRTPLWLASPLEVRRSAHALVLVAGSAADADRYAHLAERAVPAVQQVLPAWPGGLVVEVPASAAALDSLLAVDPGTYADIAAVSSSVDGTSTSRSPTHVFINPELFAEQGEVGEQVIMTHEATHIATRAPVTTGLPVWLLEGFADYVALRDTDLPMSTAAGQIIAQVRADGVPDALPGPADLDASATHLGAAYEAAWVVCLVVVDIAGEDALVRLYDDVSDGQGLAPALRAEVGVDEADLTEQWQDRLTELVDDHRGGRLMTVRRTSAVVALVGGVAFVVLAVALVPWHPIPGGQVDVSGPEPLLHPRRARARRGLRPLGPGVELVVARRVAGGGLGARLHPASAAPWSRACPVAGGCRFRWRWPRWRSSAGW